LEISASISLFLSVMGIYTLISQMVTQRRKEVGIRIAVGASKESIVGLFFRKAAVPVLGGISLGLMVAHFSDRLLRAFLFGVSPGSILVSGSILVLFLVVASTAILLPAVGSTRIDVVDALRYE
jgi:ABC-type antimicrobial peptide transport system permease subunit